MKKTLLTLAIGLASVTALSAQASVVAFWGFEDNYDNPNVNKMDFSGDVDNTVSGNANLQGYLGDDAEFDDNGGGGVAFTSSVSGISYGATRSLKFDDLKGGGDDFDIGGTDTFTVDKLDGSGPQTGEDFSNDALLYITFDGTGFSDFSLRFDVESDGGGDAPDSFDIFYRTGGSGTWFREPSQNNIDVNWDTTASEAGDSGDLSLASALDGQSSIEIIINDFDETGNGKLEIDNVEISAVPEPSSFAALAGLLTLGFAAMRRRSRG